MLHNFHNSKAPNFLEYLLHIVRKVTIINFNLLVIPCEISAKLANVEFLDLSGNVLMDFSLHQLMCDGHGGPQSLKTINISRNDLQSVNSKLFNKLKQLRHLNLRGNLLHKMPETCEWPESLHFLNLSSTQLTKVTKCLPVSSRILDLSKNDLNVFKVKLLSLTELHISGNEFGHLPDGRLYPRLLFLSIRNNSKVSAKTSQMPTKTLERLEARGNSYFCSCDFVDFMNKDLKNHQVALKDDLKSYTCDSPQAAKDTSITGVKASVLECHKTLAVSLIFSGFLALLLLSAGLCYKFSAVWFLRRTCRLRAERKTKLKKGRIEYDAFVFYSEKDSVQVELKLVPTLEQSQPQI